MSINNFKKNPLIGIIGGNGRFGSWFKGFFESKGLRVLISSRKTKLTPKEMAKMCDIVIVCVSIPETVRVIREIRNCVRPDALLCDFTSIKSQPLKEMLKAKSNCGVTGMHPLFGPLVASLSKQIIVFCSGRDNCWTKFLKKLFEDSGAAVVFADPEKHDEQMAIVQALTHFINIAFSRAVQKNKNMKLLNLFSTPVFRLQSILAGRVLGGNPELYADIEMENIFFKKIAKNFLKEAKNFIGYVERKDKNKFIRDFQEAAFFMRNFIPIAQAKAVELITLMDKQPIELKRTQGLIKFNRNEKSRVAFLGPEGTFSHEAEKSIFSKGVEVPCSTITGVFDAVMNENVSFGVVPIENSKEGIIQETMDNLIKYPLEIIGSRNIPIHINLMARTKDIGKIKMIKSHAQPIAQSHDWLNKNLPGVKFNAESSSTKAILSTKNREVAFLGSSEAARQYKLHILAKNIEDKKNNITQFYVIAKKDSPQLSKILKTTRTLVLFAVYDRPGVLRDILNHFADYKLNLTKLHSRISEGEGWDYYFFVEVEGLPTDEGLREVLKDIKKHCSIVRVLGTT